MIGPAGPGSDGGHSPRAGEGRDGRRWVIIQHVAHEGPGLVAEALAERNLRFDVVRTDRGDHLPDGGSIGGLVVMGGPMGVHDAGRHPWLAAERALIGEVAHTGRPVLGVCLGAQQLAAALGSEVTTGPEPEIGLGQVVLTSEGRRDVVTGPEYTGLGQTALPCVHWHRDTFSMPPGAVHLAGSRTFPHQAFRWGKAAYGLQFHIEVDRSLAALWQPHLPAGVSLDGPRLAQVEAVGRRLLRRFVGRSLTPVGAAGDTPLETTERR